MTLLRCPECGRLREWTPPWPERRTACGHCGVAVRLYVQDGIVEIEIAEETPEQSRLRNDLELALGAAVGDIVKRFNAMTGSTITSIRIDMLDVRTMTRSRSETVLGRVEVTVDWSASVAQEE